MSGKWPGGVISKTAPTVTGPTDPSLGGGEASGIWTMDQVADYEKQGIWPKPVVPQYFWTWGQNDYGQLGNGNAIDTSSPVQLGTDAWTLTAAGTYQGKAMGGIKSDGTLWMWGRNNKGQLGVGNTTDVSSPVQVGALTDWAKVSTSDDTTLAIKTDGTLWAWGDGASGALGDGTAVSKSSPVQIGALTTWAEVSAGATAASFALKTDGTLWNWGSASLGKSGRGPGASNVSSPVQVGSAYWSEICAGGNSNVGIQTDNTLWVWGQGADGVLGTGNTSNQSAPVQIGAAVWSKAQACMVSIMVATRTDGTLWTWGRGNFGGLGLGNTTYYSSPKQVGALTDWDQPSAGLNYGGCLKTDGTIWAWGYNGNGNLGQGDTTWRSSPIQVGALTTWKSFYANSRFGRGLKLS
jgi:alpha-tubulin suppressor-like RCC1 family protein